MVAINKKSPVFLNKGSVHCDMVGGSDCAYWDLNHTPTSMANGSKQCPHIGGSVGEKYEVTSVGVKEYPSISGHNAPIYNKWWSLGVKYAFTSMGVKQMPHD